MRIGENKRGGMLDRWVAVATDTCAHNPPGRVRMKTRIAGKNTHT